jgi:hypothetical protein
MKSTEGLKNEKPVKLHRMLNKLAETKVGDSFIGAITSAMLEQMEDGYRLAFPIFVDPHKLILQCVALLARANDPRLKAIRQLQISQKANHVLVFQAFASSNEWLKQATQMAKLFPEQPDKPELVITEDNN